VTVIGLPSLNTIRTASGTKSGVGQVPVGNEPSVGQSRATKANRPAGGFVGGKGLLALKSMVLTGFVAVSLT